MVPAWIPEERLLELQLSASLQQLTQAPEEERGLEEDPALVLSSFSD